jgi:hypothetical protein
MIVIATLTGAVFAFKTIKVNGFRVFTFSTALYTNGTIYTTDVTTYLPSYPRRFITTTGITHTTVYSLTGILSSVSITLAQIGFPTNTITVPYYGVRQVPNTFTTMVN